MRNVAVDIVCAATDCVYVACSMPRGSQRGRRWCFTLFSGFGLFGDSSAGEREVEHSDVESTGDEGSDSESEYSERDAKRPRVGRSPRPLAGEAGGVERSESASPSSEPEEASGIFDPDALWAAAVEIGAVFGCFQLEHAPTTGRRHVQGYLRFSKQLRISSLQGALPGGHFEPAKGKEEENVAYCSKVESRVDGPWVYGEAAKPGKRSDIVVAREIVQAGGGMRQVVDAVNSYQAIKCAEVILKYKEKPRDFKPEVRWYHGSTGSGKTRSAVEEFPLAYITSRNLKWWEGYDAHDVVIVDDFRKDFCTFHELLRLLDRYEFRVENKGGSRQLVAHTMVVTCPWKPDVLYGNRSSEDVGQLCRRIDEVRLFGSEVPYTEAQSSAPGFR